MMRGMLLAVVLVVLFVISWAQEMQIGAMQRLQVVQEESDSAKLIQSKRQDSMIYLLVTTSAKQQAELAMCARALMLLGSGVQRLKNDNLYIQEVMTESTKQN